MEKKLIQITAGRGPSECCWVVAQVLKKLKQEAKTIGISYEIVHREPGIENGTLNSATVQLYGIEKDAFLKKWIGTIQWVGQSTFRKFHKRKNWFVGVNLLETKNLLKEFNDRDLKYEFTRSGGPGGQHVNKVSTAVRATHIPSGKTVFVSQGRSQLQNRNEARRRLLKLLEDEMFQANKKQIKEDWENHKQLERGNPVRVFKGSDFKPNHINKKHKSIRRRNKNEMLHRMDE